MLMIPRKREGGKKKIERRKNEVFKAKQRSVTSAVGHVFLSWKCSLERDVAYVGSVKCDAAFPASY